MTTLRDCQEEVLLAKGHVFKAQDLADKVANDEKTRARVRTLLWRARGALEEIDNLVLCKTDNAGEPARRTSR